MTEIFSKEFFEIFGIKSPILHKYSRDENPGELNKKSARKLRLLDSERVGAVEQHTAHPADGLLVGPRPVHAGCTVHRGTDTEPTTIKYTACISEKSLEITVLSSWTA